MISGKIVVSDRENTCQGLDAALEMVERTAAYEGFAQADQRTLRLLADEMVEGAAAILDVFTGTLWVETAAGRFQIMLEMKGAFTQEVRDRLVELTSDNQNTPPKGFFGKLGALISDAMTGEYFYGYDTTPDGGGADLLWNQAEITRMIHEIDHRSEDPGDKAHRQKAKETLDTLADDVQVSATGSRVCITVSKNLPEK